MTLGHVIVILIKDQKEINFLNQEKNLTHFKWTGTLGIDVNLSKGLNKIYIFSQT